MKRILLVATVGLASTLSVAAQTTAAPNDAAGAESGGKSLSSKLHESGGVITPKSNVDPGIHVGAPDPHPNSTPVVPPAATGGGTAK